MILWFVAFDAQSEVTHIAPLILEKFLGKLLAKTKILRLRWITVEVHKSLPMTITLTSNERFGGWVPGGGIENRREPVWVDPSARSVRRQLTVGRRRCIMVPPKDCFPLRLPAGRIFRIGDEANIILALKSLQK